jgi:hypothetical protein
MAEHPSEMGEPKPAGKYMSPNMAVKGIGIVLLYSFAHPSIEGGYQGVVDRALRHERYA